MDVGSPDEGGVAFANFGDRFLIMKPAALYEIRMADSIDPGRTNPKIPNTQQKLLPLGSDSPLLGRTLLVARRLFDKSRLPNIDTVEGVGRSLDAAIDLSAMQELLERLVSDQKGVAERLAGEKLYNGFSMPSSGNLVGDVKSFLQKADHVLSALFDIARLFYPEVTHADSLLKTARRDNFQQNTIEFLEAVTPSMRFVREARNAIEHPKPNERISVTDYALRHDGMVERPTIEVIHPIVPEPPLPVTVFMAELIEKVSMIFEMTIVHLCFHHAECGDHAVAVIEISPESRSTPHERFSYALKFGDEWVPLG